MIPIKRFEVVVPNRHLRTIVKILEEKGVENYTKIKDVQGKGMHGIQDGGVLGSNILLNTYFVIFCSPEMVAKLEPALVEFVGKVGGVCVVSDAYQIK